MRYQAIRTCRPSRLQRLWAFAQARCTVPPRSPLGNGWKAFFLSTGVVVVVVGAAIGAALAGAGLAVVPAFGSGLALAFLLEVLLDRLYARAPSRSFPPPGFGDACGDREARVPLVPSPSGAAAVEPPRARRWEDDPDGA